MSNDLSKLARRYSTTLRKFTAREEEAVLAQAYGLGRQAIKGGFGVLDMARMHQASLDKLLRLPLPADQQGRAMSTAESFFLETLAPFEATHRGFRETNSKLQQAIATLEKRNGELAVMNRKLTEEIRQRENTEKALRESEEHFRKLFEQACAMQENLRELSNQILHAQEEERKRISRELHDETGQALTAISVTLASLEETSRNRRNRKKVRDAQRLLQGTMESLHDFARALRPPSLDELGLLPALRSFLKRFAKRTGVQICFRASPAVERLDNHQKTTLYRVVQETLAHVAKHARASRVDFEIRKARDRICMIIADNGKTVDSIGAPAIRKRRLGWLGMQERVRRLNGQLVVHPQLGKGTTLQVAIPLNVSTAFPRKLADPRNTGNHKAKTVGVALTDL